MKRRISGGDAAWVADDASRRLPIRLQSTEGTDMSLRGAPPVILPENSRKPPPRVRKPSDGNDDCFAPTPDLAGHEAAMREAFGNTLSDEFARLMLGKLMQALRPGPGTGPTRRQ
jgi:hypothetical protein